MTPDEITTEFAEIDFPKLDRSLRHPRTMISAALSIGAFLATVVACVPLLSVLVMLVYRGGKKLSLELFTELPPTGFESGGGFGNAIVGTIVIVAIAAVISIPSGVLTAIFLAEFGAGSKTASVARFCAKTLTGLPSILAGVFAYAAVVVATGTYSAPAGGVALSLLMLPTIILTAEEAMRMVPTKMKEAAIGMGCTPTQVAWKIVLPTALPGILTGVMLAIARAAGETAPLLFTALFSNYWIFEDGQSQVMEPTASLAVFIYNFSGMPFENQIEMAWAASLILVLMVLTTNITGQIISHKTKLT
ncbi:phosphate ABC transporter permease PstA [Allorhodopirellula heiligendammensis]|uniref:Phosphate transport system permease protein PstA n=1 Tax=Allorhodopirellula heiligendammensis TaxID=2714739 RepID=A0A5C6C2U4_9BACT|nr:phosphate ABC transporter permease PstA [Allorhodopirellula heiligendammensis]TWU18327.1 Phosphate transport system permease protein PstA [Allorhodopirellula heiligendammensis]